MVANILNATAGGERIEQKGIIKTQVAWQEMEVLILPKIRCQLDVHELSSCDPKRESSKELAVLEEGATSRNRSLSDLSLSTRPMRGGI